MGVVMPGDTVRCGVQYTGKGSNGAALVFHVYCGDTNDEGWDDRAFLTECKTWVTAVLQKIDDMQSDDWRAYLLTAYNETQERDMGSESLSVGGVQPADAEAPSVAALTSFKTAAKKVTGKKFFPGLVEGALLEGFWTGGVQTALADMLVAFLGGFSQGDFPGSWIIPVVFSVLTKDVRWITAAVVRGFVGSQRRRRLMTY